MDPLKAASLAAELIQSLEILLQSLSTLRGLPKVKSEVDLASVEQSLVQAQNNLTNRVTTPVGLNYLRLDDESGFSDADKPVLQALEVLQRSTSALKDYLNQKYKVTLSPSSDTKTGDKHPLSRRLKTFLNSKSKRTLTYIQADLTAVNSSLDLVSSLVRVVIDLNKERQRWHRAEEVTRLFGLSQHIEFPGRQPYLHTIQDSQIESSTLNETRWFQLLRRLKAPDQRSRHQRYQQARLPGSCKWFLDSPDYKKWFYEDSSYPLCCEGDPGVGKSTIASVVVDNFKVTQTAGKLRRSVQSAYFYLGYGKVQRATHVLASLLHQLCAPTDYVPPSLRFIEQGTKTPYVSILLDALDEFSSTEEAQKSKVYILLDAWDDSNMIDSDKFDEILVKFTSLKWQVLLTRRAVETRTSVHKSQSLVPCDQTRPQSWDVLVIKPDHVTDDIQKFIETQIDMSIYAEKLLLRGSRLRQTMIDTILRSAEGSFFRCEIQMGLVLEQTTTQDISRILEKDLPQTTQALVGRTLNLIELQPAHLRKLARTTLIWLAIFREPIQQHTLRHALGMYLSTAQEAVSNSRGSDLDDVVPTIESILASCKGLAMIDISTSTIVLSNYDVEHHIKDAWRDCIQEETYRLSLACLKFLLLEDIQSVKGQEVVFKDLLIKYPFLEYAARWWSTHFLEAAEFAPRSLVLELFKHHENLVFAVAVASLRDQEEHHPEGDFSSAYDTANSMSPIFVAVDLGLDVVTESLLIEKPSGVRLHAGEAELIVNPHTLRGILKPTLNGLNALDKAREKGNDVTFLKLLHSVCSANTFESIKELDISSENVLYYRQTQRVQSLTEVVKLENREALIALLRFGGMDDCDPHFEQDHLKALSFAIGKDSIQLVEPLIDFGDIINRAIPSTLDTQGRPANNNTALASTQETSPLCLAAQHGYLQVVSFLISRRADVNYIVSGQTALGCAILGTHIDIVKKLLASGANPDTISHGMTPLCHAAREGNHSVVELLLSKGANPNFSVDNAPPLIEAVRFQNDEGLSEKIVQTLLSHGAKCDQGFEDRTALHYACKLSRSKLVDLLLRYGASVRARQKNGRTPLFDAIEAGDEEIVQTLLDHGANIRATVEPERRTTLHAAAECGNDRIFANILVGFEDAYPEDINGSTPESCAVKKHNSNILRFYGRSSTQSSPG